MIPLSCNSYMEPSGFPFHALYNIYVHIVLYRKLINCSKRDIIFKNWLNPIRRIGLNLYKIYLHLASKSNPVAMAFFRI